MTFFVATFFSRTTSRKARYKNNKKLSKTMLSLLTTAVMKVNIGSRTTKTTVSKGMRVDRGNNSCTILYMSMIDSRPKHNDPMRRNMRDQ